MFFVALELLFSTRSDASLRASNSRNRTAGSRLEFMKQTKPEAGFLNHQIQLLYCPGQPVLLEEESGCPHRAELVVLHVID